MHDIPHLDCTKHEILRQIFRKLEACLVLVYTASDDRAGLGNRCIVDAPSSVARIGTSSLDINEALSDSPPVPPSRPPALLPQAHLGGPPGNRNFGHLHAAKNPCALRGVVGIGGPLVTSAKSLVTSAS